MNERSHKQIGESKSPRPAAAWVRPELARLNAGAAELGDVSNPDGNVNS
ncbi:MAG TPA: hypothetical protein VF645_13520 [Allosphingosinicella sp.]